MNFFEKIIKPGSKKEPEKQSDTEKDKYDSELLKRENFLKSQRGAEKEGTKSFYNYEEFKKDPSGHLIELHKKDLEEEYNFLKEESAKGEDIDQETMEMHLRNIEMLRRKIAIFHKYGEESKKELVESDNFALNEENVLEEVDKYESSTFKKFFDEKYESFKNKFSVAIKPIKYYALALMFTSLPSSLTSNEGSDVNLEKDKNKLEDTRGIDRESSSEYGERTYSFDINHRFNKVNSESDTVFNWGGIISPVSLELGVNREIKGSESINVPYTYAPKFEGSELTNETDKDKMEEYFKDQIRTAFANKLVRIGEKKSVYEATRGEKDNLLKDVFSKNEVKAIKITGFSSPEGRKNDPESVKPGNVEEENVSLAKERGELAEDIIREILEEGNIDTSIIESINYEEVQFSDTEWKELLELADSLEIGGGSDEEKIISLIAAYNSGEYNLESSVKDSLDKIVGSKRGVNIEIEVEGGKKTQVVLPLPLLLLLLLLKRPSNFVWWRRREEEDEGGEENDDEDNEGGDDDGDEDEQNIGHRQIFSDKDLNREDVAEGEFNYYDLYKEADKSVEYRDQEKIKQHFISEELSRFIDDEISIEHGLDYRDLINYFNDNRERYNTEEELKTEMARELLYMWQKYDRSVRRDAGVSNFNPETTLDYRHDEKKVVWAKIAAQELMEIIKNNNGKDDLRILIQKRAEELEG